AGRETPELARIGERPTMQVRLRDLDVVVSGARQRPKDAGMSLGTPKAGEKRGVRHLAGLQRGRWQSLKLLIQLVLLVDRAHQIHIRWTDRISRELIADHPHQLGPLLRGREPAQR